MNNERNWWIHEVKAWLHWDEYYKHARSIRTFIYLFIYLCHLQRSIKTKALYLKTNGDSLASLGLQYFLSPNLAIFALMHLNFENNDCYVYLQSLMFPKPIKCQWQRDKSGNTIWLNFVPALTLSTHMLVTIWT